MVMAENEAGDDHEEVKSPYKTPVIDSQKVADTSVMGTQYWPDPGGTRQTPDNPLVVADASASVPAPSVEQGAASQRKSNGSGNNNVSHKYSSGRHQKSGSKRNPNAGPHFPVPLPYYQSAMPPVFHATVPPPRIAVPGYAYQPVPGPFPQLVKSGSETIMHAFGPPVQSIDASRNMQPPLQGDSNSYPANFCNKRPNMQETGGHLNPGLNHQRAFNPRESITMQPGIGPRPFVRPPFFDPAPGFIIGPNFPGAVCYLPLAPPGSVHPPRFVPYLINPGTARFPPETITLGANIVKQIEYYFSDKNLQNDHYLISLMNDQGWVPISAIADFKRVKRMSTDIQFILDSLLSSSTVEVQGDNIRRRDEWSKWIPASSKTKLSSKVLATQNQLGESVSDSCGNGDVKEDNSRDASEENIKFPLHSGSLEHVSLEGYPIEVTCKSSKKDAAVQVLLSDLDESQGVEPVRFTDHRTESVELLSGVTIENVADLSNDFTHTFMLDKELELDQKTQTQKTLSALNRMDDEDGERVVDDQDFQRLVIVTQVKDRKPVQKNQSPYPASLLL